MNRQYVVRFDDGSHMVTDSFLEWCMFSPVCRDKEIEKFENKIVKWFLIIFSSFIIISLLCIYISCGSL